MRGPSLLLVLLCAAVSPLRAEAPEAAESAWLGYRWDRVASAQYRVTATDEMLAIRDGKSHPSRTVTETILAVAPRGQDAERVRLELRFERVRLSVEPQGVEFDSSAAENPRAGPLAAASAVLAAVREAPLLVALSPGGRVLEIEGMPAFLAAARGVMPEGPNRDALLHYLLPLTEGEVAERFGALAFPLPNRSVAPGEAMQVKLPVPGSDTALDATVRLEGVVEEEGKRLARVTRTVAAEGLPPSTVADGERRVFLTTTRYSNETTLDLWLERGIPLRQAAAVTSAQTIRPEGEGSGETSVVEKNVTLEALLLAHEPAPAPTSPVADAP